jgi:3-hydroxybutyryl-CoA dehydratase
MTLKLTEIKIGQDLPGRVKQITQDEIDLYAKASGDFNPIHIDPVFAHQTPAKGTIAHGMLVLSYVSQMMTEAFGQNWLKSGRLDIRFKAPARPADILTILGKVEKIENQGLQTQVVCSILCSNQNNEANITGEAIVRIKNDENFS